MVILYNFFIKHIKNTYKIFLVIFLLYFTNYISAQEVLYDKYITDEQYSKYLEKFPDSSINNTLYTFKIPSYEGAACIQKAPDYDASLASCDIVRFVLYYNDSILLDVNCTQPLSISDTNYDIKQNICSSPCTKDTQYSNWRLSINLNSSMMDILGNNEAIANLGSAVYNDNDFSGNYDYSFVSYKLITRSDIDYIYNSAQNISTKQFSSLIYPDLNSLGDLSLLQIKKSTDHYCEFNGTINGFKASLEQPLFCAIIDNNNQVTIQGMNYNLTSNIASITDVNITLPEQNNISLYSAILNYSQTRDTDNDGVLDSTDNCVCISNPEQSDIDGNGIGDSCDGALNAVADNTNCPCFDIKFIEEISKHAVFDERAIFTYDDFGGLGGGSIGFEAPAGSQGDADNYINVSAEFDLSEPPGTGFCYIETLNFENTTYNKYVENYDITEQQYNDCANILNNTIPSKIPKPIPGIEGIILEEGGRLR